MMIKNEAIAWREMPRRDRKAYGLSLKRSGLIWTYIDGGRDPFLLKV